MLLDVKNLTTHFHTHDGEVCAVNNISLTIEPGECLGVVGESGSGKTQAFMSVMGLLAQNGKVAGEAFFNSEQIIGLKTAELNKLRGVEFSMIFQDPMMTLNPVLRIDTDYSQEDVGQLRKRVEDFIEQIRH